MPARGDVGSHAVLLGTLLTASLSNRDLICSHRPAANLVHTLGCTAVTVPGCVPGEMFQGAAPELL